MKTLKENNKLSSIILFAMTLMMALMFSVLTAFAGDSHEFPWKRVSTLSDLSSSCDSSGNHVVNSGKYYLESSSPIVTNYTLFIPSGNNVTICLCGRTLKGEGSNVKSVFYLEGNAVLNIQDCSGNGKIFNYNSDSHSYAVRCTGGTVNLNSGYVTGINGIYNNCGHVNILGGKISAKDDAIFMEGGKLEITLSSEIEAVRYGVYATYNGIVNLKNSSVTASGENSAGIYLESSTAEICDGKVDGKQYGIKASDNSAVTMTGGFITATADINPIGIDITGGSLAITNGYVKGRINTLGTTLAVKGGVYDYNPDHLLSIEYLTVGSGLSTYPYQVIERPKRTVTFTDGFGNTISTQSVYLLTDATAPADPEREGYIFKGWDKHFTNVKSDLTVNALWEKDELSSGKLKNNNQKPVIQDLKVVMGFKVSKAKNGFIAKWKKPKKKILRTYGGYEIQYSLDGSFTDFTSIYVGKGKKKCRVKGLSGKKKYYVRIRVIRDDGSVLHVSAWKRKAVKTK